MLGMRMPKPRLKPNGKRDENGRVMEWELEWSSAEIAFAGLLMSAVLGFGGFIAVTQIAIGRELATTTERVRAVEKQSDSNGQAIKEHDAWARDQRESLNRRIDRVERERNRDR